MIQKYYKCKYFCTSIRWTTVKSSIQMLVIKRKVSTKGNSLTVTVPKKEMIGDTVVIMDMEAYEDLIKK